MTAAIIGGGVIGSGWAARFLLNGWDVAVFDPGIDPERRVNAVVDNARHSLPALYDCALPAEGVPFWPIGRARAADLLRYDRRGGRRRRHGSRRACPSGWI